MEGVAALAPRHRTAIFTSKGAVWISLGFNTHVHNGVATNGTRVDSNIPCPQCNCIPFFKFESATSSAPFFLDFHFLAFATTLLTFVLWFHNLCIIQSCER